MKDDCIFCKILSREIPSFVVYEDEDFKVILDRFPANAGHVLILPKEHYENLFELPVEVAQKIIPLSQKIGKATMKAVKADGINVVQNNGLVASQSIFHYHMHLIPRFEKDGVVINKTTHPDTTLEELEKIMFLIKEAL